MKKSEFSEIKSLDVKVVRQRIKVARKKLEELVMDLKLKKLKDVKAVLKQRRTIAQMLTVLEQKKLLGQLESKKEQSL